MTMSNVWQETVPMIQLAGDGMLTLITGKLTDSSDKTYYAVDATGSGAISPTTTKALYVPDLD